MEGHVRRAKDNVLVQNMQKEMCAAYFRVSISTTLPLFFFSFSLFSCLGCLIWVPISCMGSPVPCLFVFSGLPSVGPRCVAGTRVCWRTRVWVVCRPLGCLLSPSSLGLVQEAAAELGHVVQTRNSFERVTACLQWEEN